MAALAVAMREFEGRDVPQIAKRIAGVRAVIETGPASVSEMPPPEVRLVCGGRLDDLAVRCRPVVGS